MKKRISLTKSILILILALVAVYQVSELWLVSLTNRNFFLYIEARFPAAVPDGQNAWVLPFRVLSTSGNGMYAVRYHSLDNSCEWIFGKFAISRILARGTFLEEVAPSDFFAVTDGRAQLVFEYSFPMHGDTFSRALGQRRGALASGSGVTTFTSVTLMPPACNMDSHIYAFFWNGATFSRFTLGFDTRRNPVEDFLFLVPPVDDGDIYFTRNEAGFIPVVPEGFMYRNVYASNPFQNAFGLLHLSTIRPRIEHFFDNPATIIPGPSRDVYTFSNINVMVRYLLYDVLEYTSFRPIGRTAPANLVSDFSAAIAFVKSDPYVANEIFLEGYEIRGGNHVFRFGYVVYGFPLVVEGGFATMPGCREPLIAPIEVTVSHGRVVRYRRLAHTFGDLGTHSEFTQDASGHSAVGFVFSGPGEVLFTGIR